MVFAKTLTSLAARGLVSVLAGVRPKNMQKALPGGQYAMSPISTNSCAFSTDALTLVEK
jgi:hypothetical protein